MTSHPGGSTTYLERYEYTPYGQRTVYIKTADEPPDPLDKRCRTATFHSSYGCDVGHQGLFFDKETELYYIRTRYLTPWLARMNQPDPLEYADAMSLYEYVRSRPLRLSDPLGKTPWDLWDKWQGRHVKKAAGLTAGGIAQLKMWGIRVGIQSGSQTAVIFFADTCELGVLTLAAGLTRDPSFYGNAWEGGIQAQAGAAVEFATMEGPPDASAGSFEGVFHTVQVGVPTPWAIGPGGSGYRGDIKNGRRWYGGTVGASLGAGVGKVDWEYKLIGTVKLLDYGTPGKCVCYALILGMPLMPNLSDAPVQPPPPTPPADEPPIGMVPIYEDPLLGEAWVAWELLE